MIGHELARTYSPRCGQMSAKSRPPTVLTKHSDKGEQEFDFSPDEVRELLRNLFKPEYLGRSTFARLPQVDRILSQLNLRDSPGNRGIVLTMIVEDVIQEALRGAKSNEESIVWSVLDLSYVRRLRRAETARRLSLSTRSVGRYEERGSVLLARVLLKMLKGDQFESGISS